MAKGHGGISHAVSAIGAYSTDSDEAWTQVTCGACGGTGAAAVIAFVIDAGQWVRWLRCTNCGDGSVTTKAGVTYPTAPRGESIEGLAGDVASAYDEARRCASVAAFTACDLICRKLLMHVAVDKGAKEGDTFKAYLKHLETAGYITPPMKPWADLIRDHGNLATHELPPSNEARAMGTLEFTAQLLKVIYEMPHKVEKFLPLPSD